MCPEHLSECRIPRIILICDRTARGLEPSLSVTDGGEAELVVSGHLDPVQLEVRSSLRHPTSGLYNIEINNIVSGINSVKAAGVMR